MIKGLEGHESSLKVMQDYSVSFSPKPSPFPLDFGLGIWDLDLGLKINDYRFNFTNSKLKINDYRFTLTTSKLGSGFHSVSSVQENGATEFLSSNCSMMEQPVAMSTTMICVRL